MRVPHTTDSASTVRHRIRAELASQHVSSDSIDAAVLVASELVGNAVRHTDGATLSVRWMLDGAGITIEVGDPSVAEPAPRDPGPDEPAGRGLLVVGALCDDWGVRHVGPGKQVWAHVPLRRSPVHEPSRH